MESAHSPLPGFSFLALAKCAQVLGQPNVGQPSEHHLVLPRKLPRPQRMSQGSNSEGRQSGTGRSSRALPSQTAPALSGKTAPLSRRADVQSLDAEDRKTAGGVPRKDSVQDYTCWHRTLKACWDCIVQSGRHHSMSLILCIKLGWWHLRGARLDRTCRNKALG